MLQLLSKPLVLALDRLSLRSIRTCSLLPRSGLLVIGKGIVAPSAYPATPTPATVAVTPVVVARRTFMAENKMSSEPPVANKPGISVLREIIHKHGEEAGWEQAWQQGVTLWESHDRTPEGVRPLLKEVIESGEFPVPKEGRALVPGCGRGFDAIYLARKGLETWGIDLAPKAVQAAQEYLKAQPDPPSNVIFKTADFLTFDVPPGGFVLAYDYTFFCAIPPSMRPDWGKRMTDLVVPGGYLVAVVWPIDGDRPNGPPYSVSVKAYDEVLGTEEGKWTKVVDRESELSAPEIHKGRERIVVWKREDTARM